MLYYSNKANKQKVLKNQSKVHYYLNKMTQKVPKNQQVRVLYYLNKIIYKKLDYFLKKTIQAKGGYLLIYLKKMMKKQ